MKNKKKTGIKKSCKNCGKTIWTTKSLIKTGRGKYCSTKCRLACLNIKPVGWRSRKGKRSTVTRQRHTRRTELLKSALGQEDHIQDDNTTTF